MSMVPFMFREMVRPLRLLEQQMRLAEEFFYPMAVPMIRYQRTPQLEDSTDVETVTHDKNKFQLKLNVQDFAPQEITVKAMDGSILIEGKHEEKQDETGFISRQFIRRMVLPKGHDMKNVVSTLSSDGILTITAPLQEDPALEERIIPITHTGPEKEKAENKTNQSTTAEVAQ